MLANPRWKLAAEASIALVLGESALSQALNLADMLAFADKNNLLYAVGLALAEKRPFPAPYEAKMKKAETRAEGTEALVELLWPQFIAAGLPVLTMKTFLPFAFVDSNIDCFCIPAYPATEYTDVLKQAGFRWRKNLADIREPLKRMFSKQGVGETFPNYHLHTAVSWNGVHYLDLSAVWETREAIQIGKQAVFVPCPTDELLIMIAHALFENKYVTCHELIYLKHLCQIGIDWHRARKSAAQFGWLEGFEWILGLYQSMADELSLAIELPVKTAVPLCPDWHLPYQLPMQKTGQISWQKFFIDLKAGNWRNLGRKLFSYTLVDGIWMTRKARRKCRLPEVA